MALTLTLVIDGQSTRQRRSLYVTLIQAQALTLIVIHLYERCPYTNPAPREPVSLF